MTTIKFSFYVCEGEATHVKGFFLFFFAFGVCVALPHSAASFPFFSLFFSFSVLIQNREEEIMW